MADSFGELRKKVALSCRILAMEGQMKDILGHVSARIPGTDEMAIRCRDERESGLLFTTDEDIRRVYFDGKGPGLGEYAPPAELPIHGESFKARPDVGCVIHAHPPGALMCGIGEIQLRPILGAYDGAASARLALEGIPVYPRSVTVTDQQLAADLLTYMGSKHVCLMKGHGTTVTGRTVEEATLRALRFETHCRISWQLQVAGKTAPDLSLEDIRYFTGRGRPRYPINTEQAMWRYYVRLLEYHQPVSDDIGVGIKDIQA